jgi:CHASE3 domain sensor protein
MAHLLFRLRHVTEEEAMEVRQLLAAHGMETYETQAGFFRLGVDAIWLRDAAQLDEAKALLAEYQTQRLTHARREYQAAIERGEAPTLWKRFVAHPLRVIFVFVAVVVIALLTLLPFIGLGR